MTQVILESNPTNYLAYFIHYVITQKYALSGISIRYLLVNFLYVIRYSITNPKLNTSDLNTFELIILLDLVLTNSGAKNGTVPNTVASSTESPSTILQLPTSHNLNSNKSLFKTNIFYGLISQCDILFFYKLKNAPNKNYIILSICYFVYFLFYFWVIVINCCKFISAHYIIIYAYFRLEYWFVWQRVTKQPQYRIMSVLSQDIQRMEVISLWKDWY